jgi:glycosyltransferase involved in cell wall biosynthesis
VDLAAFKPSADGFLRERFNIDKGAPLIGYIGLITKRKGVDHLVRAMAGVRGAFPDARLFIIGGNRPEDEQYSASIKGLVDGLGLNEAVIFTGVLADAARAINSLDVVVLPSLEERCSRTLLEAIACEKPVVATSVGGTPEVVEDGVNGLLVAPEDPGALSEAIIRLLGDERLRREMGKKGREKARAVFDIEENMGKIRALYYKISDGL